MRGAASTSTGLTELSRYVDDVANVAPNPRLPFVGDAAFAHKGGIHVHAVAADPRTYEHLDPGARSATGGTSSSASRAAAAT